MSECEIIVKMDKHLKLKGGHYVQDLVRCEDCKYYAPLNNDDHGVCDGRVVYHDDFCSDGEKYE